jgi:hypothetical protein
MVGTGRARGGRHARGRPLMSRRRGVARRRRHAVRAAVRVAFAGAAILSIWLLSMEPFGLGMVQLFVFVGPGALLGLGAGWMANAAKPQAWTWQRGRVAAIRGALILPPVLAFIVGLDGNDRPQHLLVGFVRSAWLAFIAGGAVAVSRLIRFRSIRARRRRATARRLEHARQQNRTKFEEPVRPRSTVEFRTGHLGGVT